MLFDKLPLISLASSNWFSGFYPCKVEEPHSSLGVTDSSHFAWDDVSIWFINCQSPTIHPNHNS